MRRQQEQSKNAESEFVNISAGFEIKIKELVDLIVKLTGFKVKVVWDATQSAEKKFAFKAQVSFEEGLKRTIAWYRNIPDLSRNFNTKTLQD